MTRKQISTLVKSFRFNRNGDEDDCYILKLDNMIIYLFYFQDKPKGWRIEIISNQGRGFTLHRCINKPTDLLDCIVEYTETVTTVYNRQIFKDKLDDLNRTI